MKVVHVECGRHLFGGALQAYFLLSGLQRYSIQNTLVCPIGSEISVKCRDLVEVIETKCEGDLDFGFAFRLAKILKQQQADLVHIHSRRGGDVWGVLAAKLAGVKAVVTRHVDNQEPFWFARIKFAQFERIIATSEGIRQVLMFEGVPVDQIEVVRSSLGSELLDSKVDRTWFNHEFGYRDDEFVIGVVTQLLHRKGHKTLIDALPRLKIEFPKLRILVVGKGPLFLELVQYAEMLGVDDMLQFSGYRDDEERIIPNLNMMVHPVYSEGLGINLMQAAAAGVPAIATYTGGIPEVIQNEKTGLLVPPGRPKRMEDAIRRMVSDDEFRQQTAKASQEYVKTHFSVDKMTAGTVRVYEQVVGEALQQLTPSNAVI